MPAMACVDAAAVMPLPPGCAFAGWDGMNLPAPEPFSGGTPTTLFPAAAPAGGAWSADLSNSLYKVDGWGAPYFSVNPAGNVSVRPHGAATLPGQEIDLMKVVRNAAESKSSGGLGLQTPLVIRFPEVLKHRLESLNAAFDYAIRANRYGSHYQGVYPVKCNQDRYIVEDLVQFGSPYRFGLEAGSKPELLLAISQLLKGSPDAFLICNGYKDDEYISLALNARTMGLNTVIVLEQEEELDTVIETSRRLNIKPVIGIRAKLRTKHSGHFGSTSGEKGKFGLTTTQILSIVSKLKQHEMLDCLQLLHFHIGSQIPSTALLADGVSEAGQIYCELTRLGAAMRVVDVGGGLGIDYDGSHSSGSDLSVGYGLDEYASTVVQSIRFACDQKGVKHPILCSESGRALVSHHSVLIFEAFCKSETSRVDPGQNLVYYLDQLTDESRADYRNLMTAGMQGDFDTCNIYMDQLKKRVCEQFKDGILGLEHLAAVDGFCDLVSKEIGASKPVFNYHINLSLFTSIPDFWAIGQLFPILPIHRLTERPAVDGVLLDLTCDSDGKINRFINGQSTLPLHDINNSGPYYLGMFLGGAYQEALGGLHNLFGGPSIVRVMQHEGPHGFVVTRAVSGPSNADVLRAMQFEPELMFESIKERIEECGLGPSKTNEINSAFGSMGYLVFGGPNLGLDGIGSDSEGSSGVTEELDDEEWEMMRCLSV